MVMSFENKVSFSPPPFDCGTQPRANGGFIRIEVSSRLSFYGMVVSIFASHNKDGGDTSKDKNNFRIYMKLKVCLISI